MLSRRTLLAAGAAWRQRFDSLALIIAGLVVTIYLSGINAMPVLFHQEALRDLFVWQAGSLNQNNWLAVRALLPPLVVAAGLATLLVRPLTVLALQDDVARAMGLSLPLTRLATLGLAVSLSALVVAQCGQHVRLHRQACRAGGRCPAASC